MRQCLESSKFRASNYPLLVDSITFLALMQDTHRRIANQGSSHKPLCPESLQGLNCVNLGGHPQG